MKYKSIILLIMLIAAVAGVVFLSKVKEQRPQKAVIGLEAPPFELKDTDGKLWRLADLRGKVVLLNIWASWCETCKEELPSVQSLINSEKGNGKLLFISVLYNDSPAGALDYLAKNGFSFPVLIDTMNVAERYGITGVPETFIIDKKGIIKQRVVGSLQWDAPDIRAALTRLENE